jgi:hypothetical protein
MLPYKLLGGCVSRIQPSLLAWVNTYGACLCTPIMMNIILRAILVAGRARWVLGLFGRTVRPSRSHIQTGHQLSVT